GVAAKLRLQARARRRREVVRHDRCGTAVEGERGDEHSAVTDRYELGDAGDRLRLQDRDRVAVGGELEARVARAWTLSACGPAVRGALGDGEVLHHGRGGGLAILLLVDSCHGISFRGRESLRPGPAPAAGPAARPARRRCLELRTGRAAPPRARPW